jgi:hypothetical protein
MFGLAVRYIVDPEGLGYSLADIKQLFICLAENELSFSTAFEQHFGLSLEEFESSFFERMDLYMGLDED